MGGVGKDNKEESVCARGMKYDASDTSGFLNPKCRNPAVTEDKSLTPFSVILCSVQKEAALSSCFMHLCTYVYVCVHFLLWFREHSVGQCRPCEDVLDGLQLQTSVSD